MTKGHHCDRCEHWHPTRALTWTETGAELVCQPCGHLPTPALLGAWLNAFDGSAGSGQRTDGQNASTGQREALT
jgi:hypothetical protein